MPELPKLWLLVNQCSQCHSLCGLAGCLPQFLRELSIWLQLLSNIFYSHITFARSTATPNFTAVKLNCNRDFKSIFQTDLNCECLRSFQNELLIDLDAFEIISLKSKKDMVSKLAS